MNDILPKINIIIPCAGLGERFIKSNYQLHKPLIDVKGYPMIYWAIKNVINYDNFNYFIYLIRKDIFDKSTIFDKYVKIFKSDSVVLQVENNKDGPVITCLNAIDYINYDMPLIIANCDMYLNKFNIQHFVYEMKEADGGIVVFEDNDKPNKWSYVKEDEKESPRLIIKVAEKEAISNLATVGIYYWKKGSDFVKYAKQMISKNIRVTGSSGVVGEFYICPVYQEAINDNKKIITYKIKKEQFHNLGDPESLELFISKKI